MSACSGIFRKISTHAPLARCDCKIDWLSICCEHFNSRTSCEVRPIQEFNPEILVEISTHAPLARCDREEREFRDTNKYFNSRTSCEVRLSQIDKGDKFLKISTHAPLARCDICITKTKPHAVKFQLTHLLRGATFRMIFV